MSSALRLPIPADGRLSRLFVAGGPAIPIFAAGVLSALLVGAGLAADVPAGIALLIAVCYAPLVLVNLQLGLALWVPLVFLQGIPALNLGSEAAGLLIAAAWLGNLRARRERIIGVLRRHRGLWASLAGLNVWLTLSLAWANDPASTTADLWRWYALAVLFVVFATTCTEARAIRIVAYGFVGGAVLSVIAGIVDGSLNAAVDGAARVEGGAGDPNFLAASIVAAMVLAGGLLADASSATRRVALLVAIGILVSGLVGSASRGGSLAAGVAIVAALIMFKRRRAHVLAVTAVLTGIAAFTFSNAPATWERVTNFDNDNGRSDLWYVAWEMGADNPVAGVGLNNFRTHSAEYVSEPGSVDTVGNIVETPHFAHNTYLQLFAEGGVVGLGLFLGVVLACLGAAKRAADRFERSGDEPLATLTRAIFVAAVSILAAATFLSAALDMRLWLLLALGPALLTIAHGAGGGLKATDQPGWDGRARASPGLD